MTPSTVVVSFSLLLLLPLSSHLFSIRNTHLPMVHADAGAKRERDGNMDGSIKTTMKARNRRKHSHLVFVWQRASSGRESAPMRTTPFNSLLPSRRVRAARAHACRVLPERPFSSILFSLSPFLTTSPLFSSSSLLALLSPSG